MLFYCKVYNTILFDDLDPSLHGVNALYSMTVDVTGLTALVEVAVTTSDCIWRCSRKVLDNVERM